MLNKFQKVAKMMYAHMKNDIKQKDIIELVGVSYNIL